MEQGSVDLRHQARATAASELASPEAGCSGSVECEEKRSQIKKLARTRTRLGVEKLNAVMAGRGTRGAHGHGHGSPRWKAYSGHTQSLFCHGRERSSSRGKARL